MSSTVTIRRARLADARTIAELCRTEIEYGLPQKWNAVRISHLLQQPDTNAYAMLCKQRLIGFTIAHFGQKRMHLMLHAVAPSLRRRGLGHQLLQWQIDTALVAGLVEATLEVRACNANAQAFYQALCFVPYQVVPGYYLNQEDALCMRRTPLNRII